MDLGAAMAYGCQLRSGSTAILQACNVIFVWGLILSAATRLIVKAADGAVAAHSNSKQREQTASLDYGLDAFSPSVAAQIVRGRQSNPTKSWTCWYCNHQFSARDDSPVPAAWWSPEFNQFQPKPWTCPKCDLWSASTPD